MDRPTSLEARRIDLEIEPPFLLGPARIDPAAHEITIRGRSQRMQPQTMKVLVALHDKSGHVVTRHELVDRCWDGRIVGEDVINRCISLLRRFARSRGGFRIDTVPRGGYRLVEARRRPSRNRRWMIAAGAAAAGAGLAIAALSAWLGVDRHPIRQGIPPAPVVTVIPFTADWSDPAAQEVAEAAPVSISHMLSESGFPIILAASRAEGERKSDYVISGNVRRAGGSLAVTAQMNAVHGGTMAFSHDFEAPVAKAADLPAQIGAAFAAELAWTGAEMALDRSRPLDPRNLSELMQAISLTIEQGDSLRAYQISRRVAAMAPDSAIAQLSLAVDTGFSIGAIPREERAEALAIGRRAADRARLLAPEFGDVYITWCLLHSPVRRLECESRLRGAIRIDPSSSFVPGALSSLLYGAGRIDEAVDLARVSLANDPYKPAKMARMIRMLEVAGTSDEADGVFRQATRLWPGNPRMRTNRLLGMAEAGDYEAVERVADAKADAPMLDRVPLESLIAARRRHDLRQAQRACGGEGLKPFTLSVCMTILADLGDFDRSFAIAATLYPVTPAATAADEDRAWLDHPDGFATAILSAPASASMRSDPRFLGLAARLGLLGYWRSGRLPDFCTRRHEAVCGSIMDKRS